MSLDDYADEMTGYAMGWLGWTPDVADDTPFPVIARALEAKADFLAATTPGAKPRKRRRKKPPSQAELKSKIKAALSAFKKAKAPE
ncbi:hypothetical protein ACW7BC_18210 [Azospirillum argentinense]